MVLHDGEPCGDLDRLCDENGIALTRVDYAGLGIEAGQRSAYVSALLLEKLVESRADYCFCFGRRILVGPLLERYRNRIINFHPSLLPAFPGMNAIDQAIRYGSLVLGNTAHFIDEGVDTGPVIMQSFLPRTAFTGYDSVLDLQIPMLAQIMKWLEDDRVEVAGREVRIRGAHAVQGFFMPACELAGVVSPG